MNAARLARLLGVALLGAACVGTPFGTSAVASNPVVLAELSVSPMLVMSGEIAEVRATLENRGGTPIRGLRLALAVAEDSGVGNVGWKELGQPGKVIAELLPGERVAVSSRAQVSGDGWLRMGFAGHYAEGTIFPRGQRIRIVHPALSAVEAIALLAAFGAMLAVGIGSMRAGLQGFRHRRPAGKTRLLIAGLCLAVAVIGWQQLPFVAQSQPSIVEPLVDAGLLLFATGWWLASAHIAGSLRRGLGLALACYAVAGLGWALTVRLLIGGLPTQILSDPQTTQAALFWPFEAAQIVLGIRF